MKEFLDTQEVSELLGVGPETVRVLLRKGRIRGTKQGRRWVIRRSDIQSLVDGVKNWIEWHSQSLEGDDE